MAHAPEPKWREQLNIFHSFVSKKVCVTNARASQESWPKKRKDCAWSFNGHRTESEFFKEVTRFTLETQKKNNIWLLLKTANWCLLRVQPTTARRRHKCSPECWISALLSTVGVRNMLKSKQWTELLKLSLAGMPGYLTHEYFLKCVKIRQNTKHSSTAQPYVSGHEAGKWMFCCVLCNGNITPLLFCQPYQLTYSCCRESLVFSSFRHAK